MGGLTGFFCGSKPPHGFPDDLGTDRYDGGHRGIVKDIIIVDRPIVAGQAVDPKTERTRVLQLTDPHLFADLDGRLRGRISWQTLSAVIDHYLKDSWRADLLYLTGDLAQDESRGAYRNLCSAIDPLGLPVDAVPGNHDNPEFMREELSAYNLCSERIVSGWTLMGLDSRQPDKASGRLGFEELERLDAALERNADRPAAVFLHHPPVDLGSAWLDGLGLEDRDAFLELAHRHANMRLVVFGHAHQAFAGSEGTLDIIGTPSTVRQFKPQAVQFELDEQPPAYRRLEFCADGSFSTELVWVEQ